jgi:hypothetical protein
MDLVITVNHKNSATEVYSLQALTNTGGGFDPAAPVLTELASGITGGSSAARQISLVDIDGDGVDELVTLGWSDELAKVFVAEGAPFQFNLAAPPAFELLALDEQPGNVNHYSGRLHWGELNQDGMLDFIYQNDQYVSPGHTPVVSGVHFSEAQCN